MAGTIPLIVACTQSPEGHVTEEYERETHWSHEGEDGPAGAGVRGGVPGNVPGVSTASDAGELHDRSGHGKAKTARQLAASLDRVQGGGAG